MIKVVYYFNIDDALKYTHLKRRSRKFLNVMYKIRDIIEYTLSNNVLMHS